jgi:signal transduction histidine kinase
VRAPLAEAIEFMQASFEEKGVAVNANLGESSCPVFGDHEGLEQLFLNILMNAHEATPPGGSLGVTVTREGKCITVSVADTGPGIAADLLEKIFEPFFTTKQRGTGLGLAISAGVAQAHGARLRADNRPGGGAVFAVEFPIASVRAPLTA